MKRICLNCKYFRSQGEIRFFGVCQCDPDSAWYKERINGKDELGKRMGRYDSCDKFKPK